MLNEQDARAILASRASGVAIITARDVDGQPHGMSCSAFCEISVHPPLLLVCLDQSSDTLAAIRRTGFFAVNVLAAGRDQISTRFASKDPHKFEGVTWVPCPSAGDTPILTTDVAAHAACEISQTIDVADHALLIGRLVEGGHDSELGALLYFRRSYAAWPEIS